MLKSLKLTPVLCLMIFASLAQAANGPRPDDYSVEDLNAKYSGLKFEAISKLICLRFDTYKTDPESLKKSYISACKSPNEFVCEGEGQYLTMRGIVRSSINTVLKIDSASEFERTVAPAISKTMTVGCPSSRTHFALNLPFLKQHRNMAKRAIFLGNAGYLFNEFIFDEYSYEENGRRKLSIDINAVEYVDGEPETLLDYLDKILVKGHIERLGGSSRGDIEALRNRLIFVYGGRRARQLGNE